MNIEGKYVGPVEDMKILEGLESLKYLLLRLPIQFDYKYTDSARKCLINILNDATQININDLQIENSSNHHGRVCGHRFVRGETCWRCLTCGYDESCALCSTCFFNTNHEGHDVHQSIIQRDLAGCCDCGDQEAYSGLPCLLFLKPDGTQLQTLIDENRVKHVNDFFGTLLDFIIDSTKSSVSSLAPSDKADQIRLRHEMSFLNSKVYHGMDQTTNKYALVLFSDNVHQYRDAVQRIVFVTGKVEGYAEMIATRCNDHGRAVVMISDNIQYLLKKQEILTSTGLTACIENVREVFREEMCDDIIQWMQQFIRSNIVKNGDIRDAISRAFLVPYVCGSMHQWPDIYHEKILLNPRCLRNNTEAAEYTKYTTSSGWDIPESLKEECQYYDAVKETDHYNGSRLQFLFLFDVRFCKETRIQLHNIIVQCLAKSARYAHMLVAQFIDIYDTVLTLFLLVDREPELSIMPLLSTQIFSSPSNDSMILKHGDVNKMITSIYNYVTTGQTTSILLSENFISSNKCDVIFSTLKNRKWAHVLLDLTYIITRNSNIDNIFTFFLCFPQYVYLLKVFQSKPTFIREATQHVEYENQDYNVFFNAVSVISHFSENIGKILSRVTKERLLSQGNPMDCWYHSYSKSMKKPFTETLYTIIVRQLIDTTFGNQLGEDNTATEVYRKAFEEKEDSVVFKAYPKSNNYQIVHFDIMKGNVSFLHPLHVMLSWMIETDQSMDSEKSISHLMDIIEGEYQYFITGNNGEPTGAVNTDSGSNYLGVMGIFDIPLRKIVLSSQIKGGIWVRNGTSLKNQMTLYRYGGSREFGYMRDLFLCQVYAAFFKHQYLVPYTFLDRWNILPWLNSDEESLCYSSGELHMILEEFVLFMINLVTEDLHLQKLNSDDLTNKMIEREIVQSLCFESKSYNDIVFHIPEHIQLLKRFPIVFEKCVEPVKTYYDNSEEKIFKLKPSLLNSIDPMYLYFTANRREKCIQTMKKHKSKQDCVPLHEVYIEPKTINWNGSPFEKVGDILLDDMMLLFLHSVLSYSKVELLKQELNATKENHDSLFMLTVHLTHIAMKNKRICEVNAVYLVNIFNEIHKIYESNLLPDNRAKLKAVLKLIFVLLKKMNVDINNESLGFDISKFHEHFSNFDHSNNSEDNLFDKKRKMAQKKKKKLLAKLEKQRQKFAENHGMEDGNDSGIDLTKSIESLSDIKLTSSGVTASDVTSDIQFDSSLSKNIQKNDATAELMEEKCWKFPEHNCLLCHLPASDNGEVFGVFSYITESGAFRYVPEDNDYWFYKAFGGNNDLDTKDKVSSHLQTYTDAIEKESVFGPGFPSTADDPDKPGHSDSMAVFTSCSHGMHARCFKQYYESAVTKQLSQITRTTPENIQRREFICPLCKSINNVFIPVCYSVNSKNFFDNFAETLNTEHILKPKFSDSLLKSPIYLDRIRQELIANVKSNIKPSEWFLNEDVSEFDGSKVYSFKESSMIPYVLKNCLVSVTLVSPPFESFGLTLARTIDALEISLRGEGYSKISMKHPLIISQINNRSLISIRVWLQISEIFKSTLGVPRGESSMNDNQHLYPQSLLGLYSNLFNDDGLMFNGQDYFAALIHCEEAKCMGYPFQRLVGIFFGKHIQQSLMKIMVVLMRRNFLAKEENTEILKTARFGGDRSRFKELIKCFMDLEHCSDELVDVVYSMLIKLVTPFLRKSLILAYAKYAILDEEKFKVNQKMNECSKICAAMKIPDLESIIDCLDLQIFACVSDKSKVQLLESRIAYPGKIELIPLPEYLNDFYVDYYDFLSEEEKFDDPAICLFCGDVMDLQKNRFGDEYGSCTMHITWECMNGGKGMFFLPRNNCCLLLDNGKGSFIDSPYRDEFGEIDKEYKKGHCVKLSKKKYQEIIKKVWLTHNIPNTIAQKLESLTDTGGWSTL